MERDPKSMYKKAVTGKMKAFTGVNDPYEAPDSPELVIETDKVNLKKSTEKIVIYLKEKNVIA